MNPIVVLNYSPIFVYIGSYTVVSWWLYLLWKKTDESAYLWLMFGIGIFPCIQPVLWFILSFIPFLNDFTFRMYWSFLHLADECFAIACIAVGLRKMSQIENKYLGRTFASDSESIGEGV